MFEHGLLKGKKILITGGGSGLGKSFGARMAKLGAEIVICGRRAEVLQATAEEFRVASGAKVTTYICDVRDAVSVEAMFDAIWQDGPLDGLINNAAGNFIARTETLSPRAIDSVLNIVLHGTFYCTVAAGKRWIAEKRPGTVLSIVSAAANAGRAFTVPSASAKAGVLAMMKSLAVEWGPHGIRTVAVSPGLFPTKGAWENLYPEGSKARPEEMEVPLRRVGDHVEISNLVSYLMSDQAGYISGECITIDGGRDLQNGGGAGVVGLFDWTPERWDEFKASKKS
ncbi:SDR family oxidoreductase [Oryzicola mucosus]|uniref:Peroxisomal trans-2-enoyl-CoA reductase n=1 Tax=Oryzicola mucosus TaxID=2767425 RepID=A0A8J6PYP6_9HYPH|nr:SDR family oxidoreductase [Oryzicola mucosus]MBD0416717.1 SDR family oxidoreductase [Oryzicola mucosus]